MKDPIKKTVDFVKDRLKNETTGHDWWHIFRVWKNAVYIGKKEKADLLVVELAALLHDIADWKFHNGDTKVGPKIAKEWLEKMRVSEEIINQVCHIIEHISFKGAKVKSRIKTLEGQVVQDADRLDALGAIGIARAFAYGGAKGRLIYEPEVKPELHKTFRAYRNSRGTTINHFYEKLLLLKDLMNTSTGKKLAATRHHLMTEFLKEFYKEWGGK